MTPLEDRPGITAIVVQGGQRKPVGECACCGREMTLKARGLCSPCHRRESDAGTLGDWGWTLAERIEEFSRHRASGMSVGTAATLTGVSGRTGSRYERRLKQTAG